MGAPSEWQPRLLQYIDRSQLPVEFGGDCGGVFPNIDHIARHRVGRGRSPSTTLAVEPGDVVTAELWSNYASLELRTTQRDDHGGGEAAPADAADAAAGTSAAAAADKPPPAPPRQRSRTGRLKELSLAPPVPLTLPKGTKTRQTRVVSTLPPAPAAMAVRVAAKNTSRTSGGKHAMMRFSVVGADGAPKPVAYAAPPASKGWGAWMRKTESPPTKAGAGSARV